MSGIDERPEIAFESTWVHSGTKIKIDKILVALVFLSYLNCVLELLTDNYLFAVFWGIVAILSGYFTVGTERTSGYWTEPKDVGKG